MTNKPCSEHYVMEPTEGVLQYCPHSENAEWVAEGLRAIASLRSTTTVLIKNVCENHKDPVTKWNEAMQRVKNETPSLQGRGMSGMDIDMEEYISQNDKIIQFPKK